MKNLLVVLLTLSFYSFSFSQFSIQGKIVDQNSKEPLIGAHVQIIGTYIGAHTNQQGEFRINDLKKGKYSIHISYLGYQEQKLELQISKDEKLNIELLRKPYLEDEIIISATMAGDKTPTTYIEINRKALEEKNVGQDLPIILNTTPSIVTNSDAGTGIGYTGLRIRGTDQNRINVTLNGIPYNDAESHGVFWVNLPDFTSSIENIQIQRGVGTSTNGAAAFGGSINIQTNKLIVDPYTEISNSFGSFNSRKHTVKAGTGLINDKFTFDARLSRIYSDGYIDRAFSDLKSYYLSAAYYSKKSILRFNMFSGHEITYQSWGGVPADRLETDRTYNPYSYDNQVDNYEQDHYQLHFTHQFHENLYFNASLHLTQGEGYFEELQDTNAAFSETSLEHYGLEAVVINNDSMKDANIIRRKWLDNDFYGFIYSLNYEREKLKLILGGGYNRYDGDHFGEVIWASIMVNKPIRHRWYESEGLKTDFNSFFKIEYLLGEKMNLFGDIQFRKVYHEITGTEDAYGNVNQDHDYNFINPKFGIYYDLNQQNSAYLSFAISNREPNRNIFLDYINEPEAPKHETLFDIELGHNLIFRKFLLNTNVFYMMYQNQLVPTGEVNLVGYPLARNVDESYRAGIEFVFNAELTKHFQWKGNLTLSQNKINDYTETVDEFDAQFVWIGQHSRELGKTDIAFSPNIIASSILSYNLFKNLEIGIVSKYVGKQFIDNTSSDNRTLDAYLTNNLQINYRVKTSVVPEISFHFMINNLLNEKYESNAWIYAYYADGAPAEDIGYFPQAGTNFFGGLTLKF